MLHLASKTDPAWSRFAVAHLDEVLLDHAHCEKKAASTAINLIFRYTDRAELMEPLSALAREELEHFEQVIAQLRRRGVAWSRQFPSAYAAELMKGITREEPGKLVDTLLCCSLIEARSCERMQVLADELRRTAADPELSALYDELLACEARHHTTYVDLARRVGVWDDERVRERLAELSAHEAAVVAALPVEPRLHSRAPADAHADALGNSSTAKVLGSAGS